MNKQQLANRIWAAANRMRMKIDSNEYKDYLLGLIFYKFLSDNEVAHLKSLGWTDEDLPDLVEDYEDEDMAVTIDDCKNSIGYFIEYKNLFSTWPSANAQPWRIPGSRQNILQAAPLDFHLPNCRRRMFRH